jgi:alkanesulfonate monooxygenase SsuD/methylene tetrahydromethanopterin reductase-like flavin-dependent oxidoreductase (luciferase family)
MRGIWSGEPFSFDGVHYSLDEVVDSQPVQRRMPIIVGGSGGVRSAAVAARFADEYNTPFVSPEVAHKRRRRHSARETQNSLHGAHESLPHDGA